MQGKSIKLNYIYNTFYQVFSLITPLITAPYLSRVLGASGVGTISFIESVVSYFSLFACLGIATYGQREIAYGQDDRARRTKAFWEIKILNLITTLLVLGVYVPFSMAQEDSFLFLLFSINLIAAFFDITWLYQGLENFGTVVLRNSLCKIAGIVFVFFLVKSPDHVWIYILGNASITIIANLSLWLRLSTMIGVPVWKDLRPFGNLKGILSLFIPTIAIQVYTVLDKTMIGLIVQDPSENGYYEQAIKLSKMLLTLISSLGTVMIPRIGYYFEQKQTDKVLYYIKRSYRFVFFLGIPLVFGLISVASSVVPWFFGSGYEKVVVLLCILSVLILFIGLSGVTGTQYFIPTKRQNVLTLTVSIGAVTNLLLNLCLIPAFRSVGAAIASVIAEFVVTAVQLFIIRKELPVFAVFRESWRYWIAGGVMFALLLFVNSLMAASIVETLLLVFLGALIYFLALFLLKDRFFFDNISMVLNKLWNKKI